jgi:uncharacterized protein YciI
MAAALFLSLILAPCFPRLAPCEEPKSPAPPNMTVVYMVLLKKGPSWSPQQTPETKAVQEAHMANIRAMWEAKKLIIAGPFGDDGDLRGVFLFQVASLEEAKALAATDPAVKAGRLAVEIHPWWVEKRALPESGSYCQGAK